MPEAVTQLATPVTALCYNLMLASLVGDIGISTFSVLSFIFSLANAILSGVAQGLQPLWGHCCGKGNTRDMGWYFYCGLLINSILSVLIYGVLFFFDRAVIRIFNSSADLVQAASAALPLFSLSFIPVLYQKNRSGKHHCNQQRDCDKSLGHFLYSCGFWKRLYLDRAICRRNRDSCARCQTV